MMKALVYEGPGVLRLAEKPMPELKDERDCIVQVALASVCTSDLHIRDGFIPRAVPGTTIGHEYVGTVVKAGSAVKRFRVGDRVAASCLTICGECAFCKEKQFNCCERGGWNLGCCEDGGLAEFVRVPLADGSLAPIPASLNFKQCLLVGDVLASGLFGTELVEPLQKGQSVLIIGAGPVGQCTGLVARKALGADVTLIDPIAARLALALEHGACDRTFA